MKTGRLLSICLEMLRGVGEAVHKHGLATTFPRLLYTLLAGFIVWDRLLPEEQGEMAGKRTVGPR